jgi:hypothetical protein
LKKRSSSQTNRKWVRCGGAFYARPKPAEVRFYRG